MGPVVLPTPGAPSDGGTPVVENGSGTGKGTGGIPVVENGSGTGKGTGGTAVVENGSGTGKGTGMGIKPLGEGIIPGGAGPREGGSEGAGISSSILFFPANENERPGLSGEPKSQLMAIPRREVPSLNRQECSCWPRMRFKSFGHAEEKALGGV